MSNVIANSCHTASGRAVLRCALCDELIEKGQRYRRCVYIDCGIETDCTHVECDRVTMIDKWDDFDWECRPDGREFRKRRNKLRDEGKLATEMEGEG